MIQLAAAALAFLLPSLTQDQETFVWEQWNGPQGDGVSRESSWSSKGKEEPLWSAEVGLGYSTVVTDGKLVYTMGYDKAEGIDIVWCFDALTGEEVWTHSYEAEIMDRAHEGGTVNTPSIDGDVLHVLNREGKLYCLERKTGEVRWFTMLLPEDNPHGLERPTWGFSGSPLVLEDELILNCGKILSVDKSSGEVRWASRDYGHAYCTPITFEHEGRPVLAILNGEGVAVLSRADGSEIAFQAFTGETLGINAPTPVLVGQDSLFISSGPRDGNALFALEDGELREVWANKEMINSFSGCVLVGEHLYGYHRSLLRCITKEGEECWSVRGTGNGAVSAAGDRILAMTSDGELIVCKADPEEYEVLLRTPVFDDGGRYWTKPVIANGVVYCRSSRGGLVARDHRQ